MERLFIQMYIPAFDKTLDLKITNNLKVFELRDMVYSILASEYEVECLKDSHATVCDKESGVIFNINLSVGDLKMRNGSQLMLI